MPAPPFRPEGRQCQGLWAGAEALGARCGPRCRRCGGRGCGGAGRTTCREVGGVRVLFRGYPQTTTRTFSGEPRVLSSRPGLRGRLGDPARDSPSAGVGFPRLLGCLEAAKSRASCGLRVWGLSARPRPALRWGFSLHTEKIRGGSGLSQPFWVPTSPRRRPGPSAAAPTSRAPHHSRLAGRRRVPLSPPRRLLGPGDGAESDVGPAPGFPWP